MRSKQLASSVAQALGCISAMFMTYTAHAEDLIEFRIAPQPLETALLEYAEQTGTQIAIAGESIAQITTKGVSGKLTPRLALARLIEDSNLEIHSAGKQSYSLVVMQAAPGASKPYQAATDKPADPKKKERSTEIAEASDIETVLVTAQKRQERLIDVPQSVTVLSSNDLTRTGATQFRDFANNVPGLSFSTAGAGNTRVILRGVTTGFDIASTVGIYVDDVPYGSSSAFTANDQLALDVGLFDIDRIEVLRGPQGTLYGASTMGGLLKYHTRQPSLTELTAAAQTGVSHTKGGDLSYNGSIAVNVPLVEDKAAIRASGFYSADGGYIDNVARGDENANSAEIYGARVNLLFRPTDELSVQIGGFVQDISRDGEATSDYSFDGRPIDGSLEQSRFFAEPFEQRFRLISGTVNYDFGPALLTSISSYQTSRADFRQDVTPGYLPFVTFLGIPASAVGTRNVISTDKFTQEVRLTGRRSGPVEWVVGGYYTDEDSSSPQSLLVLDPSGQPLPNIYDLLLPSKYEEYAAFGDLTWYFTDKFDVTGGVRYAENRQSNAQIASGMLVASRPTGRSSEDVLTYLANARYRFSDHATAYARFATGYRPGGPNYSFEDPTTGLLIASEPFEADRLKSYEVGFKTESADRRFGLDVAVYHIDWSDFQISVIRGGFAAKANAQTEATIRGVELGLSARLAGGLTATGAFAYQDARMADDEPNLLARKDERLPNVPRFTAAVGLDYSFEGVNLAPSVGLSLRHISDRTASFDNTVGFLQYDIPEFTTVDLRAGMGLGEVRAQFFVRNLFDERSQLSALNTWQGLARPAILQPRTFGISLTANF